MSHLFQRPLCDMGAAFDYAFRPILEGSDESAGGPCDDRPHRVELFSASTDPRAVEPVWRSFSLCPDHEAQLAVFDARLVAHGVASRFRSPRPG
jgi:hypothetical protein